MGPLLLLTYVNDIARALPGKNSSCSLTTPSGIEKTANASLIVWKLANCLCMNLDKTNFMFFPSNKNNGIAVLVNGHCSSTYSSKYLGLYIDDALNWKNHIEYINGKLL